MVDRARQAEYCRVYGDELGRLWCCYCKGQMRCPEMGGGWCHKDSPGTYCRSYTDINDPMTMGQHRRFVEV